MPSRLMILHHHAVKTLCVAAMLATLSSTVFLMVLYTNDSTSNRYARYRRRMQDLLFSFDPSLFPNASGIFNRSFGIGGQDQSRPQFPLSSLGGIFNVSSVVTTFGNISFNSFGATGKLLANDFGSEFPVDFEFPDASTKSPTKRPTKRPSTIPTRLPSQRPSKSPSRASSRAPSKLPTMSPVRQYPLMFASQVLNPAPRKNTTLDTFPNAKAMRDLFLSYFTAAPTESFESYSPGGAGTSFTSTFLTNVGNVTFTGALVVGSGTVRSSAGFRFPTDEVQWLEVDLDTATDISFPQYVVGAGFVIVSLGGTRDTISPYNIIYMRDAEVLYTFGVPIISNADAYGSVTFIGFINDRGFNKIVFTIDNSKTSIDQFNAFTINELRP
jgi:hypothetical protein